MSAEKFTQGPWRVESLTGDHLPRGPIHQVLAEVNGYPSTVCTVEEYAEVPDFEADRLADARLLAAAPAMLQALRIARLSVMEMIEGYRMALAYEKDCGHQDSLASLQGELDIINDAIMLATGEQP